jgi:hypothetical protein
VNNWATKWAEMRAAERQKRAEAKVAEKQRRIERRVARRQGQSEVCEALRRLRGKQALEHAAKKQKQAEAQAAKQKCLQTERERIRAERQRQAKENKGAAVRTGLQAPNRIPLEKAELLKQLLLAGKSLREAARLAGVAKGTAFLARCRLGGIPALVEQGVKVKMNRWG